MVDPVGLAMFILGIVLIVIELSIPGYFIGVGGTSLVLIGLIQIFWEGFLFSPWSPFVVPVIVALSVVASVLFYRKFAPPAHKPETMSSDALVGEIGRVTVEVVPNRTTGKVKIGSTIWSAEAEAPIPEGTKVIVERVEGVHVVVKPAPKPENSPASEVPTVGAPAPEPGRSVPPAPWAPEPESEPSSPPEDAADPTDTEKPAGDRPW